MGRSLESETPASNNTAPTSPAIASMESLATPEVDQTGPEPEIADSTPAVLTPPLPGSNGDATPASSRLASITGLFLSQKSSSSPHQWNSTSGESATPLSPSTTDSDQAPPSFPRAVRFDEDDAGPRRTASFGSAVTSTLNAHRRATTSLAAGGPGGAGLTEPDLRRFVFHHPRAKRLVSGLRVHALTRQAFVSSFTVGLAIGSVVAIVLKILKDLAGRMLYS